MKSMFKRMGTHPMKITFSIRVKSVTLPPMRGLEHGDLLHFSLERGSKTVNSREKQMGDKKSPVGDIITEISEDLSLSVTLYRDSHGDVQEKMGTLSVKYRKPGMVGTKQGKDAFKTIGVVPLHFHDLTEYTEEEMSLPLAWCAVEGASVDIVFTARQVSSGDDSDSSTISSSSTMRGKFTEQQQQSRPGASVVASKKPTSSGYKPLDDDPKPLKNIIPPASVSNVHAGSSIGALSELSDWDTDANDFGDDDGVDKKANHDIPHLGKFQTSTLDSPHPRSTEATSMSGSLRPRSHDKPTPSPDARPIMSDISRVGTQIKPPISFQEEEEDDDDEEGGPLLSSSERFKRAQKVAAAGVSMMAAHQKSQQMLQSTSQQQQQRQQQQQQKLQPLIPPPRSQPGPQPPPPLPVPQSKEAAQWQREIEALRTENRDLRDKIENLEVMTIKADHFAAEARRLELALTAATEERAAAEQSLEELRADLEEKEKENASLLQDLITTKMSVVTSATELEAIKRRCLQLRGQVTQLAIRSTTLEVKLAEEILSKRSESTSAPGEGPSPAQGPVLRHTVATVPPIRATPAPAPSPSPTPTEDSTVQSSPSLSKPGHVTSLNPFDMFLDATPSSSPGSGNNLHYKRKDKHSPPSDDGSANMRKTPEEPPASHRRSSHAESGVRGNILRAVGKNPFDDLDRVGSPAQR